MAGLCRVNSGSDWSSISEDEENVHFVKAMEEGPEPSLDKQPLILQENKSDMKNGIDLLSSSIMGNGEPLYE